MDSQSIRSTYSLAYDEFCDILIRYRNAYSILTHAPTVIAVYDALLEVTTLAKTLLKTFQLCQSVDKEWKQKLKSLPDDIKRSAIDERNAFYYESDVRKDEDGEMIPKAAADIDLLFSNMFLSYDMEKVIMLAFSERLESLANPVEDSPSPNDSDGDSILQYTRCISFRILPKYSIPMYSPRVMSDCLTGSTTLPYSSHGSDQIIINSVPIEEKDGGKVMNLSSWNGLLIFLLISQALSGSEPLHCSPVEKNSNYDRWFSGDSSILLVTADDSEHLNVPVFSPNDRWSPGDVYSRVFCTEKALSRNILFTFSPSDRWYPGVDYPRIFSNDIYSMDTQMNSKDSWFDVFQNVLSCAIGCAEPRTVYLFTLNDRWYPKVDHSLLLSAEKALKLLKMCLFSSNDRWYPDVARSFIATLSLYTLRKFCLNDRSYPNDNDSSRLPPDSIHGRDNPRKIGLHNSDYLFNAHDHVPTDPKCVRNMKCIHSRGSCRGGRDDSIR